MHAKSRFSYYAAHFKNELTEAEMYHYLEGGLIFQISMVTLNTDPTERKRLSGHRNSANLVAVAHWLQLMMRQTITE